MFNPADLNNEAPSKNYLRSAGIHQNATFVSLTYEATENYECYDIILKTSDDEEFRHREFAPDKDKIFLKKKYKDGKIVGEETKEEAYIRKNNEIAQKIYYLAIALTEDENLNQKLKANATLKEFVEQINSFIHTKTDVKIDFFAGWKNIDSKEASRLFIPDNMYWVRNSNGGKANITLSKWQKENLLVEKYPYINKEDGNSENEIISSSTPINDDLPF